MQEEDYGYPQPEFTLLKRPVKLERVYTTDDIEALPEGKRAELVDGKMYMMASPNLNHQLIALSLFRKLADFIDEKGGECKALAAPLAVYLNQDEYNYFEPDVMVVCDRNKLSERGVEGAPDLVIEVVSKSSYTLDLSIKYEKYHQAGVKEYWVVDPMNRKTAVHNFEKELVEETLFEEETESFLFEGFKAKVADALL
ncbi:MAG: Uma2 family endonuclease [Lachnospiraceae bacterium]|nr:Uma2 family endonuclease [Lachnospiraceae bacterium]